jgi:hypothetical protein
MSIVKEETTLEEYLNGKFLSQVDFNDTFSVTNHKNNLHEISKLIFNNPPQWISWLFNLRNKLVKIVGLKTEIPHDYNTHFCVGGYIGFFRIFSISDTQLVLGADDSHLNFRAIILKTNETAYNVKVVTLVQYNNSLGRFYMHLIKPFHVIVVKRMVKNAYNET